MGGLQRGLRAIPDPKDLMLETEREIAGIPSMTCGRPRWSLNKVLWEREVEELDSGEEGCCGGG